MTALRKLAGKPLALAALVYLVLLVAAALLAPVLPIQSPTAGQLTAVRQGPSWAHWLGTDQIGRDTLSRLIWGARPTLLYTAEAVTVALAVGLLLGATAGFVRGRADDAIIAVSDVVMAMPGMVMLLVVLTIFATHMDYAMIALGLLLFAPFMRVIRAATLAIRRELYIDAAQVAGLSTWKIMLRHILPRIRGVVLVQGALLTGMALLLSTGVAYLGFGTQPPNPSWGLMIGDGAQIMGSSPSLIIAAGSAIGLTVIACGLLGDGLRDLAAERWAGGAGRRPKRPQAAAPAEHLTALSAGPTAPDAILTVHGLCVCFAAAGGDRIAVRDVSLHVSAGETLGIVGESGSGKTSIARAVLGILPGGHITGGHIVVNGQDITGIARFSPDARAALRIGYIAQEPHASLDPAWRVGSLVAESIRRHRGLSRRAAWQAAIELFSQVQLDDPAAVAHKYPHELSGGMAQRVAIARALTCRPRLLVADEPTTALDVTVQAGILDLLRSLQASTGMALLLITHDWGVVADICDRAVVLRGGQIIESATVTALYATPKHEYTRTLLAANPALMVSEREREGAEL
jgi:peptide/nickel transport system permease protein